jgi:hypothetical protein
MAEDAEGAAGATGSAPGAGAGEEEEEDMAAARRGRRCRARWWDERRGDLAAAAAAAREAAQREERERARVPPMAGVKYRAGRGEAVGSGAVAVREWRCGGPVVGGMWRGPRNQRVACSPPPGGPDCAVISSDFFTSFGLRQGRFRAN